ncbi:MAG TPA: YceI family protein [Dokdonella sp.]|uniref:YceI family protein n=1 Tax=Dokdonella sp. TaxID=2291710 RepID=UPI0025C5BEE1|nr:YceI family protein [Dokdonella sp.]MBX3690901.1 polyisoprenoid-binding protein [Dokdonella sp.]MCW5567284.1 polyisoprenoid-binding protein [Dokdonella sp.]HNR92007.1 YceI family protein [Dokdonella sp.]
MRVPLIPALLSSLFLCSLAPASEVPTWRFDPVHSQVVFFVDHLGFSKAIGRARVDSGRLAFDPEDWSTASIDVTIALDTLDMGEPKWTATVRSAQFLDADRWPGARFRSTAVEQTGANALRVHGLLSLHGREQPLTIEATLNRVGRDPYTRKHKVGFSARAKLDRFAFGIERYRDAVGAEVDLRIEIEAVRTGRNAKENNDDIAQ